MKDNELKDFLNKNSSVPRAPETQWTQIQKKIEPAKTLGVMDYFTSLKGLSLGASGVAIALVVIFSNYNQQLPSQELARLKKVDTFLASDSYFSDSDPQYSWVGDNL